MVACLPWPCGLGAVGAHLCELRVKYGRVSEWVGGGRESSAILKTSLISNLAGGDAAASTAKPRRVYAAANESACQINKLTVHHGINFVLCALANLIGIS